MTTTLQEQARALGDPTRHEIFRYIADAGRPIDVAELTAHLGLNHNAIRQHLAKLVNGELVTEGHAARTGRGRPRLTYSVHPAAESRWGVAGPYERLSLLLVEMLRTGDSAVEVGRRSVRPRSLGKADEDDPMSVMVDEMARQGFDPAVRARGERVEVVLRTCPFATTALADPDTVCSLHLGIAEGVAQLVGESVVVDELVPHDPRRANCRLRLHLRADDDG
jgi:predicted ArsR family transcriptional regulator